MTGVEGPVTPWRSRKVKLREQPRKTIVRSERDELESDQTGFNQGQGSDQGTGLLQTGALEHEHRGVQVGAEVAFPHHPFLLEGPDMSRFGFQVGGASAGVQTFAFNFKGEDFHLGLPGLAWP